MGLKFSLRIECLYWVQVFTFQALKKQDMQSPEINLSNEFPDLKIGSCVM